MSNALCRTDDTVLLIVDVQERLLPAIHDGEAVVDRCLRLATAAGTLGVPVLGTEQYPQGLGPNVPALRALCADTFTKRHFAATAEPGFLDWLPACRSVVLAGCEAHVCVLQTAIGLLEHDIEVKLVADAVGSRDPRNRDLALQRLRDYGADVVGTEMVLFEWLHTSAHPAFRTVSRLIR
ncbi:isochorismatase family protein [Coralloluteibacterium thermophilus]|uniref:Isochorismatase family protein n=1 Tax=Coralloluteibacterium thermophilum TaxID=2707049 RepID=A0ABV9NLG0_9GAMM